MKEKNTTKGSAVHGILKESGLEIAGWETADCGFGIQFPMPVIVVAETGEKIDIGPVNCPAVKQCVTA